MHLTGIVVVGFSTNTRIIVIFRNAPFSATGEIYSSLMECVAAQLSKVGRRRCRVCWNGYQCEGHRAEIRLTTSPGDYVLTDSRSCAYR
jgi:hypothetical protein